jgi:hypothetical protein
MKIAKYHIRKRNQLRNQLLIKTLMIGAGNDSSLMKKQIKKIIEQLIKMKY